MGAPVAVALLIVLSPAGKTQADFVGHGAPVRDIVISPDGKFALTAGFDDQAILWDTVSSELRKRLIGHEAAVNAARFLDLNGRSAAVTVSDDGTARLWDLDSGDIVRILRGHEKKVVTVDVSGDGRLIATGSWDRTVRLWDAASGQPVSVFEGHRNNINAVRFQPDGQRILSAGYDGEIWSWPVDPAEPPTRFARVGFPINDLAVSADGARIITGSADGIVRVWDVASRAEARRLEGHQGAVLAVAQSPDSQMIASGGADGQLLIWAAATAPRLALRIPYYRAVWSIAFSADSRIVYAAGVDRVTRGWLVETGAPVSGATTPFQPVERVSPALANSDDPVERGSYHFRKCAICHSLTDDGVPRAGPSLAGIFGRRAGHYPGYAYSPALANSTLVWDDDSISRLFALGPQIVTPGSKMPLQRLPDERARQDLVAFLKIATRRTRNGPPD